MNVSIYSFYFLLFFLKKKKKNCIASDKLIRKYLLCFIQEMQKCWGGKNVAYRCIFSTRFSRLSAFYTFCYRAFKNDLPDIRTKKFALKRCIAAIKAQVVGKRLVRPSCIRQYYNTFYYMASLIKKKIKQQNFK